MAPPVGGYYAWYDATQISGVADGTVLTSWPDLSGNSRDLNVHTGTPTFYKTTSAPLIHGNPTVMFHDDGHLATTAAFSVSQPYTVIVVARLDSLTRQNQCVIGTATTFGRILGNNPSGGWSISAGTVVSGGAGTIDTTYHVLAVQFNGASSFLRVDGISVVTGNASTNGAGSVFLVGASATTDTLTWTGPVGEIIYYPSALSTTDIGSVESYLTTKWASPPGVTGTAASALGPLALAASGLVPVSSSLPLGPLAVTAAGTASSPSSTGVLVLGPLAVASRSVVYDQWGNVSCARMAWLTLGSLSVPLQDEHSGYFCSSLDLGYPAVRDVGTVTNRPDRDGTFDRTQFMGARVVTANITALTGAGARIDAIATQFAPFMQPSARPVLHYVLDRPGALERTLVLRAAGYAGPIAGAYQRDLLLQWTAADPYARDPAGKTVTATPASVGSLVTPGDVAVRPLVRIGGPITGPVVQFAPAGGITWFLAFVAGFVIGSGHYVDVDTEARTVYLDGDPAKPRLSSLDWTRTSWQWIPPQPSSTGMSLSGAATTTATKVTATWNDGYLT